MPVHRKLLLATEHTEFDVGAEALAFALAARPGTTLQGVLPIVSNPEFEVIAPQLAERADRLAAEKRRAVAAAAVAAGVTIDLRARHGLEPFEEIVDEARDAGADLIVIRRRGKRGFLADLLLGEMVGKVVAHAPCSVLIAPRAAAAWQRCVLVGIDPMAPGSGCLKHAAALAAEWQLPLWVVCVAEAAAGRLRAGQVLDEVLELSRRCGARADGEVRIGRAHQALIDAARERGADLIVVGRHGDAKVARAWIGGTAQKVVGLADGPVLVHVDRTQEGGQG